MKSIESILKIADIHAERMKYAMENLKDKVPFSADDMENLSNENLAFCEIFSSRFSKLQDLMGSSLFTTLLEVEGEPTEEMTFIDKLNKLEKLNLISNAKDWMAMRQIRNNLAHEYPDHPELIANFFNTAFEFGFLLLRSLNDIKDYLKRK